MKNIATLLLAFTFSALISCGPSAEEQAAEQKRIADSVAAAVAAQIQDSLAQAEIAAQESMAAAMKAAEDSMRMKAMQDSLAALQQKVKEQSKPAKSGTKTTIPAAPLKQDDKPKEAKPGMGRG